LATEDMVKELEFKAEVEELKQYKERVTINNAKDAKIFLAELDEQHMANITQLKGEIAQTFFNLYGQGTETDSGLDGDLKVDLAAPWLQRLPAVPRMQRFLAEDKFLNLLRTRLQKRQELDDKRLRLILEKVIGLISVKDEQINELKGGLKQTDDVPSQPIKPTSKPPKFVVKPVIVAQKEDPPKEGYKPATPEQITDEHRERIKQIILDENQVKILRVLAKQHSYISGKELSEKTGISYPLVVYYNKELKRYDLVEALAYGLLILPLGMAYLEKIGG